MAHERLKVYKVYITDDPGLTLTFFTERSNLVPCEFIWGYLLKSKLMGNNLQQLTKLTQHLCLYENVDHMMMSASARGPKHVYKHYFQISASLKSID